MKFKEFKYERIDMESFILDFNALLEKFDNADSFSEQNQFMQEINKLRNKFDSMESICYIRHSIDTRDEFYEKENDFFDENKPKFQELISKFYRLLVDSKFRPELEAKWGSLLFKVVELSLKTFNPEIIEDLQKENKLSSQNELRKGH